MRSRPSRPLTVTTLLIALVGVVLPLSPFASALGFVALPPLYFLFLALAIVVYLSLVEIVKRWLMRRRHESYL